MRFIRLYQVLLFVVLLFAWDLCVRHGIISSFFFGEPLAVAGRIYDWFVGGDIYRHLWVTLLETVLSFVIGAGIAIALGVLLALVPFLGALLDPYITAANSMPRVILAPIFVIWFGLGIWSKVALGVSIVFFLVFFNVINGIRNVNPVVLANAIMLGGSKYQIMKTLYLPSAASWVFSGLHVSVGMAFVGSVVGEYLGSVEGVGYLILQAEGVFDINTVFAGIFVLTVCALLLDKLVSIIEARLLSWSPAATTKALR